MHSQHGFDFDVLLSSIRLPLRFEPLICCGDDNDDDIFGSLDEEILLVDGIPIPDFLSLLFLLPK